MAYFGKEFKFEKEENYEEFIKSISAADETAAMFLTFKPNYKIDKKGDEYVMTLTNGDFKKEISFKPGVAFEEDMSTGLKPTTVFTVDGDTFTQVQDYGSKGKITLKREFSVNQFKLTITSSKWDGVAYRYYVPA